MLKNYNKYFFIFQNEIEKSEAKGGKAEVG